MAACLTGQENFASPALRERTETVEAGAMPHTAPIARAARSAFWLAAMFAVTMASLPKPPQLGLEQFGDKVQHIVAFLVLAVLANLGWPRTERVRIIERLSLLGAVIEMIQSIPELHRDCDIRDWIADSLAVIVVAAGFALWSRWRTR